MHRNICILGGTGFVGSHLLAHLSGQGRQMKVLTRHADRHRDLLVLPDVELFEADCHDPEVLRRHFAGQDAVINLVGILNERGDDGRGFARAHNELARKVIEACKAAGVRRLLHMSALNADPQGPSHYLQTKGVAENHAHENAGDICVTSFRPSVIFGPGDSFLNRFAGLLRISPFLPLAMPEARFAPTFVGDVADAYVAALDDHGTCGQRIDLCGPKVWTLRELVEFTAHTIGVRRLVIGLPGWASRLQAEVFEHLPGKPLSRDNLRSLSQDSVCPEGETCPTMLEAVAPDYLAHHDHEWRIQRLRQTAGKHR